VAFREGFALRTDLDLESEVFALPAPGNGLIGRPGIGGTAMTSRPPYDEARFLLQDMAGAGDNLAQHALALSRRSVTVREPMAALAWSDSNRERLPAIFYANARELIAEGQDEDAAGFLGAALALGAGRSEIAAALAICAARMERYDTAVTLAELCLRDNDQHPRMLFIAGFCELKRGNRRASKTYLAKAARLARSRSEFRADQRAAQRLLLILQFAQ
jgi:tetratricopeptide (TPR) repeat protein